MFLFSEDPPLKSKGYGLSVLLHNLFDNSDVKIRTWFCFLPTGSGIGKSDIQLKTNGTEIFTLDFSFLSFLRKKEKVNQLYRQFLFCFYFPFIILHLRNRPHEPVVIPIGASALILYKIWLFMSFTPNPIWLYVVDDLNEIAIRRNRKIDKFLCRILYKKLLFKAQRVFGISNHLADILSQYSKKKAEIILPCFQKIPPLKKTLPSATLKRCKIVFTGGLSFLYNDTLKQFSDFLAALQKETNIEFTLIIQTYSSRSDFQQIGFTSYNTEYRTSGDRSELYKTYQEADLFIVPYSFDSAHASIVSTSFPQKVAQLIQLGVPIVVFGPAYSSVVDFFIKQKMKYVIQDNNYDSFRDVMLNFCNQVEHAQLVNYYIDSYERFFSQKACLKVLEN